MLPYHISLVSLFSCQLIANEASNRGHRYFSREKSVQQEAFYYNAVIQSLKRRKLGTSLIPHKEANLWTFSPAAELGWKDLRLKGLVMDANILKMWIALITNTVVFVCMSASLKRILSLTGWSVSLSWLNFCSWMINIPLKVNFQHQNQPHGPQNSPPVLLCPHSQLVYSYINVFYSHNWRPVWTDS